MTTSMIDLKPQIEAIAQTYIGEEGKAANANEFLVNMSRVKQSNEFFGKLENELE